MGFKSFVEPTELMIEKGLTGVVGPNGCGKSNLLEALRWVMGETSFKSMRASAMDDVIFSGTSGRPARAMAEVTIFIDNTALTAPAEFNDRDHIEVTRRIEREQGSSYRINGQDARARDVKILFEDAATGARSPALVRQGQVGEIVNAKPEQRRRILEDAAGIAGLHSRRHEAELRLKAAEGNLVRIGDVLGQLKSQVDGLKRQARQAKRYIEMSEEIRVLEAIQMFLNWREAQRAVDLDEGQLRSALEALGFATKAESEATRAQAEAAEKIQPLRDAEIVRSAVVARLRNEQASLEKDAERAAARCHELRESITQIEGDIARERSLVAEAGELQNRLNDNLASLAASDDTDVDREKELDVRIETLERDLAAREEALEEASARLSRARADRSGMEARIRERSAQAERLSNQLEALQRQAASIAAQAPDADRLATLVSAAAAKSEMAADLEEEVNEAEAAVERAEGHARSHRETREAAALAARQIETEVRTLANLLDGSGTSASGIVERLSVRRGYETALGAAFGDDLEAPVSLEAPLHWRLVVPAGVDGALPDDVRPLSDFVSGAPELERRLRQTGVVSDQESGERLQRALLPGQTLVSKSGALWRWDGYVARAGAPTAAAQRLELRNRLAELREDEALAAKQLDAVTEASEAAGRAAEETRQALQVLRQQLRTAQAELAQTNRELAEIERIARETQGQLSAIGESRMTVENDLALMRSALEEQETALEDLPELSGLEAANDEFKSTAQMARDALATARAEQNGLRREREHRAAQRAALEADIERWYARAEQGRKQIAALETRFAEAQGELERISSLPDTIAERQQKLTSELNRSEKERQAAADSVVTAEATLKEAAAAARSAQETVALRREERARAEARLEGARIKRHSIANHIEETLQTTPEGCLGIAGLEGDAALAENFPVLPDVDAKLSRAKTERERLGGVNLQAQSELEALTKQYDELDGERADVEEAVLKLKSGITNLNREGRRRLREAFDEVDNHFRSLFTTLFGGGEARLEMVEDPEDPLAGGLEITAKPPGKKPTSLSLLSGGEQTLTALSLIFAVFLTNPSPICVLDEVDAPLDDANVDRFCRLMEKMAQETDTRFLVITHHPMTMARMDRLFGVTMVEKGVSQLVSVDLAAAEQFLEAG
jgi:chromosome segregation protein